MCLWANRVRILSGQSVELNNDLMELLRKAMITNTGVPSSIINAFDEVDFSRTLVMQHTKYMARIISIQTELEGPISAWYRQIMRFDSSLDPKIIEGFKFRFTRPKSLNTQNMVDMIGNSETLADFITKMISVDENDSAFIAEYKQTLIKKVLLHGVFNWEQFEDMAMEVKLKLKEYKAEKGIIGDDQA